MAVNGGGEGLKLLIIDSVFVAISVVAVVLRLVARKVGKQSWQLNDWLIILGLVFSIGQSVLDDLGVAFGSLALPDGQTSPGEVTYTSKLTFSGAIIWGLSLLFIKLSVLHFYYVVFPIPKFRVVCILMMVVVATYFVAYTAVTVLGCLPISMEWNASVHGTCLDVQLRVFVTTVVNTGIDLLIVLLPLPVLSYLNLNTSRRLFLSGIFTLGIIVCAVSGMRLYFDTRTDLDSAVSQYITILLEPDLGILVACLPLLYSIIQRLGPSSRSNTPASEIDRIIRFSPGASTLPADEEMVYRVRLDSVLSGDMRDLEKSNDPRFYHQESRATLREKHEKPGKDESYRFDYQRSGMPPYVDNANGRVIDNVANEKAAATAAAVAGKRPGNRTSLSKQDSVAADDKALARMFSSIGVSRPKSWRQSWRSRSDWPLSSDAEQKLSDRGSAAESDRSSGALGRYYDRGVHQHQHAPRPKPTQQAIPEHGALEAAHSLDGGAADVAAAFAHAGPPDKTTALASNGQSVPNSAVPEGAVTGVNGRSFRAGPVEAVRGTGADAPVATAPARAPPNSRDERRAGSMSAAQALSLQAAAHDPKRISVSAMESTWGKDTLRSVAQASFGDNMI